MQGGRQEDATLSKGENLIASMLSVEKAIFL